MSSLVAPVGSIARRIASIESRFGVAGAPADDVPVLGSTAAFDPFGAAYAAAVESVERSRAADPAMSAPAMFQPLAARPGSYGLGAPAARPYVSAAGGGPATEQIAAAVVGQAGAPGVRQPGGYGAMPVPSEIAVFGNGQVPDHAMQHLEAQHNHRLAPPAAAAWDSAVRAAAADGVELRITDSYRPYAEQVDLAERKGLYSQGGLAATPGTSNHGWGLAVDADVTEPATLAWLRTNGARFGFVETSDREPWHWEFRPHQV